jgi:hypothetical protein
MALALAFACTGCSGQAPLNQVQLDDVKLREVGELYRLHQVMIRKAPRSLKDLGVTTDLPLPSLPELPV